jgi:hypothetical protein
MEEQSSSSRRGSARGGFLTATSWSELTCRATAQAVSRWIPTVGSGIPCQGRSCGIYDGQSGTGVGILRVNWFNLQILVPDTAPYSLILSSTLYNFDIDSVIELQT